MMTLASTHHHATNSHSPSLAQVVTVGALITAQVGTCASYFVFCSIALEEHLCEIYPRYIPEIYTRDISPKSQWAGPPPSTPTHIASTQVHADRSCAARVVALFLAALPATTAQGNSGLTSTYTIELPINNILITDELPYNQLLITNESTISHFLITNELHVITRRSPSSPSSA